MVKVMGKGFLESLWALMTTAALLLPPAELGRTLSLSITLYLLSNPDGSSLLVWQCSTISNVSSLPFSRRTSHSNVTSPSPLTSLTSCTLTLLSPKTASLLLFGNKLSSLSDGAGSACARPSEPPQRLTSALGLMPSLPLSVSHGSLLSSLSSRRTVTSRTH